MTVKDLCKVIGNRELKMTPYAYYWMRRVPFK